MQDIGKDNLSELDGSLLNFSAALEIRHKLLSDSDLKEY
jgi:hypothetical protein